MSSLDCRPKRKLCFELVDMYKFRLRNGKNPWLGADLLLKMIDLDTPSERIRANYVQMAELDCLPKKSWMKREKDPNKAQNMRERGNQHFREGKYKLALEFYNESLCFAPVGSSLLGLAYANRAAIYLKTGFFTFCLENIELALQHGYPEGQKRKLNKRKETCLHAMTTQADSVDVYKPHSPPKLSHPANPKVPSIIDALQYKSDDERYLVTKVDLKPGEIVLMEKPFLNMILRDGAYTFCYNCTAQNFLNLRPCPNATMVMFCSDHCAEEAWKSFYKFECPIVYGLYDVLEKVPLFAIRLALKMFTMFDTPAQLREFIASIGDDEDPLSVDYNTATELDKFRVMYSMKVPTIKDLEYNLTLECTAYLAMAWCMLKRYTPMKEVFEVPEDEDLFLNILMKLMLIVNSQGSDTAYTYKPKVQNKKNIFEVSCNGSAMFSVKNILSHSCAPNLGHTAYEDTAIVTVVRPIKAGERVNVAFITDHFEEDIITRRPFLKSKLYIDCNCEACTNDYGTLDTLPKKGLVSRQIAKGFTRIQFDFCHDDKLIALAEKTKDLVCDVLASIDHHYPCFDIHFLQLCMNTCFEVMFTQKPLELIFTAPKETE